jgi:hypothetical protein
MSYSNSADSELLKSLLQPLLDDFQFWFGRSRTFLESNQIPFLGKQQQADLLVRVIQAQQEVNVAQSLFKATDGQVGVETSVLLPWHELASECCRVATCFYLERSRDAETPE